MVGAIALLILIVVTWIALPKQEKGRSTAIQGEMPLNQGAPLSNQIP